MKSNATFHFSGQDSLSQFMVWIIILGAGCMPLPLLVWDFVGKTAAITSVFVAFVVLPGLRASIAVYPSGVVITKSWFFVPYWRYTGPVIEDVCFGGDWGEAEGASGIVVELNGKEIHIGSRKTMHQLHAALSPLTARRLARPPAQADGPNPDGSAAKPGSQAGSEVSNPELPPPRHAAN